MTGESGASGATIRPRKGDLEAATSPHPFRPSGEFVGYGTGEKCDLCGLVQRGTWIHPSGDSGASS